LDEGYRVVEEGIKQFKPFHLMRLMGGLIEG
jgi:hypothetical protein